ncbi:uncharacterized protein (TIGR02677 family) [Arthrobacter sp. B3I9]|uniref:TIGR02677 family protein n=1 Tax=Arthrobacter sp. B3I9 TaxID=3042270 RepID=UPI00278F0FD9|nr:TIGR02677 family protein [Arthrobacter sp. B3I9]MDQ0851357.1 uncharacterized protein (TIGR02677 family) [Arthrobacter sp. B3I9]
MDAGTTQTEPEARQERRDLYRYVTADNAEEYIAIMRLFSSTLLADLSAGEAQAALERSGALISVDDLESRCRQLEQWGNLVRSVRDARAATVAEWVRSRSRYQVSKLGGRVARQVDEVISASDGAREVARELLGVTVETLQRITDRLDSHRSLDTDALAGDVTTVFQNQRFFAESATDFYAFVQSRISRYDLGGPEYAGFKEMLMSYVDLITADVARHAPAIATLLEALEPRLPALLDALDSLPSLPESDGTATERSPGRNAEDWEELTAWYTGRRGRSGPAQLRGAADQALAQLIANAKRMLAVAGTGVSRRADLLRLARWFDTADADAAHRIFNAAFGAYPSRHLLRGPDEDTGRDGATTSWWDAEPVDVPLSLRERGDRAARGRTARVLDPGLERELLLALAQEEADRLAAAAAELTASGNLDGARLSPAARNLLLDRFGALLAVEQNLENAAIHTDTSLGLALTAIPARGRSTVIHSDDGTLTVHDLLLRVHPAEVPVTLDDDEGKMTGTGP